MWRFPWGRRVRTRRTAKASKASIQHARSCLARIRSRRRSVALRWVECSRCMKRPSASWTGPLGRFANSGRIVAYRNWARRCRRSQRFATLSRNNPKGPNSSAAQAHPMGNAGSLNCRAAVMDGMNGAERMVVFTSSAAICPRRATSTAIGCRVTSSAPRRSDKAQPFRPAVKTCVSSWLTHGIVASLFARQGLFQ